MLRNFSTLPRHRPKGSEVLTAYINQCKEPPWTSYFIRYKDIKDDQWGMSHFNWKVGTSNYHILRTGCYPYIKYHCTKRSEQDLQIEDNFFRAIKVLNLGNILHMINSLITVLLKLILFVTQEFHVWPMELQLFTWLGIQKWPLSMDIKFLFFSCMRRTKDPCTDFNKVVHHAIQYP